MERDGSTRRVARMAGIVALVALLVLAAVFAAELLLLVFGAILVAIIVRRLAVVVERALRLSSGWSFAVAVGLLVGLGLLAAWLLAPSLVRQFDEFVADLPRLLEGARRGLASTELGRRALDALADGSPGGELLPHAATLLSGSFRWVFYLAFVVITGLYLAHDPGMYARGLVRLFPLPCRARAAGVLEALGHTLAWFLVGRIASMAAVGVLTALALWLLDVPLAALLGLVAGLLTFVPYAGPFVAGVPIGIVAFTESPMKAVYALALYTVIQSIEGFVITPLVQERVVALPPALTLVAEVFMGLLFGALGVIVSVPLAAALLVLVRLVYVEGVLGDRPAAGEGA